MENQERNYHDDCLESSLLRNINIFIGVMKILLETWRIHLKTSLDAWIFSLKT
jgi:hypothetical protein